MGIFSAIKSRYKMSQAAVVVQNLLELQARYGLLDVDPALLANKLVAEVWTDKPDVFDGKFGQRPHKFAVAAIALANGFRVFSNDYSLRNAFVVALGEILKEIEANGRLYPFSNLDNELFNRAASAFFAEDERLDSSSILPSMPDTETTPKWDILKVFDLVQFTLNVSGKADESQETWTFTHPNTGESVRVISSAGDAPFVVECCRTKSRHLAGSVDRAVSLVGEVLGVQGPRA